MFCQNHTKPSSWRPDWGDDCLLLKNARYTMRKHPNVNMPSLPQGGFVFQNKCTVRCAPMIASSSPSRLRWLPGHRRAPSNNGVDWIFLAIIKSSIFILFASYLPDCSVPLKYLRAILSVALFASHCMHRPDRGKYYSQEVKERRFQNQVSISPFQQQAIVSEHLVTWIIEMFDRYCSKSLHKWLALNHWHFYHLSTFGT